MLSFMFLNTRNNGIFILIQLSDVSNVSAFIITDLQCEISSKRGQVVVTL